MVNVLGELFVIFNNINHLHQEKIINKIFCVGVKLFVEVYRYLECVTCLNCR